MAFNDTPGNSSLTLDRSSPVGNSAGADDRGRLHTKVANKSTEPIPITTSYFATTILNEFNTITALASEGTAFIVEYTVPVAKKLLLNFIEGSGDNFGVYQVFLDNVVIAEQRTHFSNGLNALISFGTTDSDLFIVNAGSKIQLQVYNYRTESSNYSGRIFGALQDV